MQKNHGATLFKPIYGFHENSSNILQLLSYSENACILTRSIYFVKLILSAIKIFQL